MKSYATFYAMRQNQNICNITLIDFGSYSSHSSFIPTETLGCYPFSTYKTIIIIIII